MLIWLGSLCLKLTTNAPVNWICGRQSFPFGARNVYFPLGKMVSFRECNSPVFLGEDIKTLAPGGTWKHGLPLVTSSTLEFQHLHSWLENGPFENVLPIEMEIFHGHVNLLEVSCNYGYGFRLVNYQRLKKAKTWRKLLTKQLVLMVCVHLFQAECKASDQGRPKLCACF